jgi:hypothetical protein
MGYLSKSPIKIGMRSEEAMEKYPEPYRLRVRSQERARVSDDDFKF